jgi:hypothetical protein
MGNGRGNLMNAVDQIVNAPCKIDDLSLSLQLKLDRIVSRSRVIHRFLKAD